MTWRGRLPAAAHGHPDAGRPRLLRAKRRPPRKASVYTSSSKESSLWNPTPGMRERKVSSVDHLRDIVAYVCKNYPYKDELSNARVTKMVYLADWRSAITRGKQLTDLEWEFSHYGPYVNNVIRVAEADPAFEVVTTKNPYGGQKDLFQVADNECCLPFRHRGGKGAIRLRHKQLRLQELGRLYQARLFYLPYRHPGEVLEARLGEAGRGVRREHPAARSVELSDIRRRLLVEDGEAECQHGKGSICSSFPVSFSSLIGR